MRKFKEWCAKERVDRVEKGTSQDMCSTNGDSLFFICIMLLAWSPLAIFLISSI